ncbi:MAG TPA: hypothetical protein VMM58_11380 [Bacteroidota bacterium]|nr:hypothetical protein [Bacteroidota bacterium]
MNAQLKITLILLATLIIGIVVGVVGRGVLVNDQHRKLDATERTEIFLSRVDETVDPDSSQKPKVDEIAKRAADRIAVLFDHHDAEMASIVDSMKRELAAILTPGQMQRLNHELTVQEPNDSTRGQLGIAMAFSYEYAERLQRELNLDSAQTDQLLQFIRESHNRIMKEKKSYHGDPEGAKERREAFLKETNKKIEALLNPRQLEQFHLLQRERERFVEHELKEEDQ